MKKEFLAGYRTTLFYFLATVFYILWIFYGRGLSAELWLWSSAMFITKNAAQSLINFKGNNINGTITNNKKPDNK